MSLKNKEKSVADTGTDEPLVALPNRSARRLGKTSGEPAGYMEEQLSGAQENTLHPRQRDKLRQSREILLRMEVALRNGRLRRGQQRSPMMGMPEAVSTDGDSSIPTRKGGAVGSFLLKYVRALLIHDQHDSDAKVWEEGAVEVLSECCRFHD